MARSIPDSAVDQFHALVVKQPDRRKYDCADEVIRSHPDLLLKYLDLRSLRQSLYIAHREAYFKTHPHLWKLRGERVPKPEGSAPADPLAGYTQEEILAAADREVAAKGLKDRKVIQRLRDHNRISSKIARTEDRVVNAVEAYYAEILQTQDEFGDFLSSINCYSEPLNPKGAVLIFHLSDVHANELIDLPHNRYDFLVMAQRLRYFVQYAKLQGKAHGVQRIALVMGGDLINSDRRLDELLSQAANRSAATMLAAHLFAQAITDLAVDFYVDVVGITGNEGRAKQELGWGFEAATDSYDAMIYNVVRAQIGKHLPSVTFAPLKGNETMIEAHGVNVLVLHGHQVKAGDQKNIQAHIGRKATEGIAVDLLICGHIHASLISDFVARNSSMCGANAYSAEGLGLASKAAQNLHIITADKRIHSIKVDLQNVEGVEGYEVESELCHYHAKSVGKTHRLLNPPTPVVFVV